MGGGGGTQDLDCIIDLGVAHMATEMSQSEGVTVGG